MIGQIKNLIGNEISGAVDSFASQLGLGNFAGYNSGAEGLMYPLELRGQADRPCIEFTAYDTSSGDVQLKTIWFPCPAGIEINDQATYNTIDLGALGGALNTAFEAAGGATGLAGKASAVGKSMIDQIKSAKAGEITALAAMALPGYGDKLQFKAKTILNPNTNTNFTGNTVRSFNFGFKMIARSEQEAKEILRIHKTFRKYTYADSNGNQQNLTLRYPPVWRIRFLDGQKNENKYIPKIFSCYLQNVTSTFNSTSPTFHTDGSPLEVDITLAYQETRALTRFDIENLGDDENRGIGSDGLATEQGTSEADLARLNDQTRKAIWEKANASNESK
jgi:hypothetical protein